MLFTRALFLLYYFFEFSKFLFGIPCTFTFVFLPSISVLEILLFNFQRSCARPPRKHTPFRGEPYYSTISRPSCQAFFKSFSDYFSLSAKETDFRSKQCAFCNKRTENGTFAGGRKPKRPAGKPAGRPSRGVPIGKISRST